MGHRTGFTLALAGFLMTMGCGASGTPDLPQATVLLYDAPETWTPWEPEGLVGNEPLYFVSGFRSADHGTVQLQTMPTPRPFLVPQTAQEIQEFAATMQGTPVRRWLALEGMEHDGRPGIYSVAETSYGIDHRWIVFGRDKIFLLSLGLPPDAGSGGALPAVIRQSMQLK